VSTLKNDLDLIDLMTVDELAKILRISRFKAYKLISQKEIDVVRCGRSIRIPYRELKRFIEAGGTK
jgi:excisionase family DNA binding protein